MAAPSRLRFPQLARNNLPTSALAGLLVTCGKQAMPTPVFVAVFALCGLSIGLIGPPFLSALKQDDRDTSPARQLARTSKKWCPPQEFNRSETSLPQS
jgi:hypothetical protein